MREEEKVRSSVTALLSAQAFATAVAGALAWWFGSWPAAAAAAFGGGIALANSLQSAWWLNAASCRVDGPQATLLAVYAGAVQRLVLTVAGFAAGFDLLHLLPIPMLAAFAGAQLGHLAGHWRNALTPWEMGAASCDSLQR